MYFHRKSPTEQTLLEILTVAYEKDMEYTEWIICKSNVYDVHVQKRVTVFLTC